MNIKPPYKLPLIIGGLFIVLCIIPFVPVIIFYLDGGMISIVNKLIFNDVESKISLTNWIVNFGIAFILLFCYIQSKHKGAQVTFLSLALIFIYSFIAFSTMDFIGDIGEAGYLLYSIFLAILSSLPLIIAGFIKTYTNNI